jgi:PAS domain S-box-containing protein
VGAKILIVEDETIVAKDLCRILEGLGHTVVAMATSGEEAVASASQHRPDLILMDIRLGGTVDGVDAARRILQTLPVPIVYTTAYADQPTFSRAIATNPFGYLVKPVDERDLRTAVEMALLKHRMEMELLRRVKLEAFVADIAGLLLGAHHESGREVMFRVLDAAAAFAQVDRCLLLLLARTEAAVSSMYEWYGPDLSPLEPEYNGLHMEKLPWLMARGSEGEPVCIRRVEDLPQAASREKDLWVRQHIGSLLATPIMIHGMPAGWFACATVERERLWGGEDIRFARLVAQNVAGFLSRLRAEGAVVESEEKFRTLVEHLREVIFSVDAKGYFTFIGASIEPIAGFRQEEIIGEHFSRFVHPHDRDGLVEDWQRTSGGRLGSYDFRIMTKGGDVRWVRTSSRPVYDGETLSGMTGIMMDVTGEKDARTSLSESEDRYRKLWELSTDGLVLINGETGEIIDCNAEFSILTGRTKDQLRRMCIWQTRPPELREAARKKFLEIAEQGLGGSSELSLERPDGTRVDVDFLSGVIQLEGKRVIQSRCRRLGSGSHT